jgi:GDP-4-dehydro-6-deoxy-D-mannose reductase
MSILVTGAAGFAGQHLLARLHAREATGLVGTAVDGTRPGTGPAAGLAEVCWLPLDLTDPASVDEVVARAAPRQVYHLAAQSSVGASFRDPDGTWAVNATGFLHLVSSCAERVPGCRILLVSSAEVYGTVPEEDQPIEETRPPSPITPYGASKAAAEMLALAATRSSAVEVVVARSFNHTGAGQHRRFALPGFALQLSEMTDGRGQHVLHTGDLGVRRDFLDVRDVVAGYVQLMESGEPATAYNVCSGVAHSLADLVDRLISLTGLDVERREDLARRRPADIDVLTGSPRKLEALGWTPRHSIDDMLSSLYDGVQRGWT